MTHAGVILILGAGPNVGNSVASLFAQNKFKVALVGRSLINGFSENGYLEISADLADDASIPSIFQTVEERLGAPNIVVYNGARRNLTPPNDPLSVSLDYIHQSQKVGFDSAYIAAQQTLRVFRMLPSSTPKAFIYTGNALNQIGLPGVLPFTIGKVCASALIEYAANAYGAQGFRFYYADERREDGKPAAESVSGTAHGRMYWELANEGKQSKWLVTFTKERGRHSFPGIDYQGKNRWGEQL